MGRKDQTLTKCLPRTKRLLIIHEFRRKYLTFDANLIGKISGDQLLNLQTTTLLYLPSLNYFFASGSKLQTTLQYYGIGGSLFQLSRA
jgi:hypothetical protein